MHIKSKLSSSTVTIFTAMSALATKHGALNLGQGFPDYDPPTELLGLVKKYIGAHKHQYAPMAGVLELREAISKKMSESYGQYVHPETDITITAGATQAIFTTITALVHPGDEVIIFEPAYDSYRPAIEIAGGKVVVYAMEPPDFKINWHLLSAMINSKTRMIIINTPHNPTGTILSEDDMKELSQIVRDTDIIILSDEVYEHLVFDGLSHESVLKYPELYQRSIAVFSFGKTYHCTGWKIGYCIAPEYIMKEIRRIHQWNVFCVNSFLQNALAEYLDTPEHYLMLKDFYQQKRDYFLEKLVNSRFQPLKSSGTYFQLCEYSNISSQDDVEFSRELISKYGVAGIPVSAFYTDKRQDRLIRFCFAKTESLLTNASELLCKR
ncbi:MAG: aminotransferase class I/II-fold pyridoxal phosphate-dependent enzyme [Saprospiraceae bacterium]|nr:aminotransferase class I/II-fold pyridoxal phosphate-dependent enzyme [Saprospiraceae bacterium]